MTGHRIKVSDDFDGIKGPDGRTRLVLNEARQKAKKAVCDRFPKRKEQVRYGRKAKKHVVGQGSFA